MGGWRDEVSPGGGKEKTNDDEKGKAEAEAFPPTPSPSRVGPCTMYCCICLLRLRLRLRNLTVRTVRWLQEMRGDKDCIAYDSLVTLPFFLPLFTPPVTDFLPSQPVDNRERPTTLGMRVGGFLLQYCIAVAATGKLARDRRVL